MAAISAIGECRYRTTRSTSTACPTVRSPVRNATLRRPRTTPQVHGGLLAVGVASEDRRELLGRRVRQVQQVDHQAGQLADRARCDVLCPRAHFRGACELPLQRELVVPGSFRHALFDGTARRIHRGTVTRRWVLHMCGRGLGRHDMRPRSASILRVRDASARAHELASDGHCACDRHCPNVCTNAETTSPGRGGSRPAAGRYWHRTFRTS